MRRSVPLFLGFLGACTTPTQPRAAAPTPAAPQDRPVAGDSGEVERLIAPYVAQGRQTYPAARQRYLAGLPPGHRFYVTAILRRSGKTESVFVAVTGIAGGQISGTIANDVAQIDGVRRGDPYRLPESELIDWTITRPDGSEEGNVVGKFLDELQRQPR